MVCSPDCAVLTQVECPQWVLGVITGAQHRKTPTHHPLLHSYHMCSFAVFFSSLIEMTTGRSVDIPGVEPK